MTARDLVDKIYGTQDLKDISEFNISLDSAVNMMETYADKVKNLLIPIVSVNEFDIDTMFPYEDIETARPTRPEKRIIAYNSRQADRREGAKRLLEKLNTR